MKRDPNISLLVNDTAAHSFVTAHGTAQILEMGEAKPHVLQGLLEKYVPEERREQYTAALASAQTSERIVVELHPEKILGVFNVPVPE